MAGWNIYPKITLLGMKRKKIVSHIDLISLFEPTCHTNYFLSALFYPERMNELLQVKLIPVVLVSQVQL